ncbi:MAG: nicotinate phosphoribosyltransferase, partial [Symbiobacteriaceae bacterium]|nr:nicotinate phosphoribosyltransferase [Symbiobacteriaceae bacterium]
MSRFDGHRLPGSLFRIDTGRMRDGWYSDDYFVSNRDLLSQLAKEGYRYAGEYPSQQFAGIDPEQHQVGDSIVEMQIFTRRAPFTLVAGVDEALAILEECVGYYDDEGQFVSTFDELEIEAVEDGTFATYKGDPMQVQPVIRIRGRYRDFAMLETVYLGVLSEASRIATNVYTLLEAALEKRVFFFPARFAHWKMQGVDGYAYAIAVDAFKAAYGSQGEKLVSTLGQGEWWGGAGAGTVSHAL